VDHARRRPLAARLAGSPWLWLGLVAVLFGLPILRSVSRQLGTAPAVLGTLPSFELTDQTGKGFGTRQLAGKVWVANFMFTACEGVCPLLTQRMVEVGRRTKRLGPDFHLVSISVDPARDTPERLAAYGARYGANPASWSFLTGSAKALEAAVVDGFKVGMGTTGPADAGAPPDILQIFHGENLVLVDRQLRIRGYFQASPEGIDLLVAAVGRVVNES
jgi:protein SCO1/2